MAQSNAADMLKRLKSRKQNQGDQGVALDEQPIGSDQLFDGDNEQEQAENRMELPSEDQPVSSDDQPVSDLIAQINDASADGDADSAPVIDVPVEAQGDPVVQRMMAQLAKLKANTDAVAARIEKRATKVVTKATKATAKASGGTPKSKAAKRQPESVAEMFPRFPTLAAVWGKIVDGQSATVAEGEFPTIQLSINATAKQLDATRPTVKNAVHALVKAGILVDTTPELNAAHTYEVHAPDFSEAIAANAALPVEAPAAEKIESVDDGQHETNAE